MQGGRSLNEESLELLVSVSWHKTRYEGCSSWSIWNKDFWVKSTSRGMTMGHETWVSPTSLLAIKVELLVLSSSLLALNWAWSLATWVWERGWSTNFLILWRKVTSCVWPLCLVLRSNFHGRSKRIWQASIRMTSHKTLSLYLPMKNFMSTWSLTLRSPSSLSQWNL